jgi:hypothetical protein
LNRLAGSEFPTNWSRYGITGTILKDSLFMSYNSRSIDAQKCSLPMLD